MADGDEHALDLQFLGAAAARVAQPRAGDLLAVAEHLLQHPVPGDPHLALALQREQPLLQDLVGAQFAAAVHQGDRGGEPGQVQGLLDRGVAAAHHRHRLGAEEEAVAGGAGRDAAALVPLFRRQAEVAGGGAGGDDQRVAAVLGVAAGQPERRRAERDRGHLVEGQRHLVALRVALHAVHQVRPLQARDVARPVVDVGGGHQLPARLHAGDQQQVEAGAGGVDRGRVAGRARAQDDQLVPARVAHGADSSAAAGGSL